MTNYTSEDSNFGADGPFFRLIREGLDGLVDGDDYFDLLADDVVFEYVISLPGYPRRVKGRQSIIDLYAGYDDYMRVHSADSLRVYETRKRRSLSSSTRCTVNQCRPGAHTTTGSSRSSR